MKAEEQRHSIDSQKRRKINVKREDQRISEIEREREKKCKKERPSLIEEILLRTHIFQIRQKKNPKKGNEPRNCGEDSRAIKTDQ